MTSNSISDPEGVVRAQCLSLMHEAQRYFQLLNHTSGSTANLNFSLILFAIFHLLLSPLGSQRKKMSWLQKKKPYYEDFFKITFILIASILFSCMCGAVELNK